MSAQNVLERLEPADRAAELLAHLGVPGSHVARRVGAADCERRGQQLQVQSAACIAEWFEAGSGIEMDHGSRQVESRFTVEARRQGRGGHHPSRQTESNGRAMGIEHPHPSAGDPFIDQRQGDLVPGRSYSAGDGGRDQADRG